MHRTLTSNSRGARRFTGAAVAALAVALGPIWLLAPTARANETTPGAAVSPGAAVAPAPAFELASVDLVLSFRRTPTELDTPEKGASVELYGDGRVVVRRPSYMKRSGTWEGAMQRSELEALVRELVESGLVERDRAALLQERSQLVASRAEAARARGQNPAVYAIGDPDLTELTLRLEAYRPAGDLGGGLGGPVERSWRWMDLYGDSARFPEMAPLAAFGALERRMAGWIDRQDLQKLEEAAR